MMDEVKTLNISEVDIFQISKMLWDSKLIIIFFTFITIILGVAFNLLKPSLFMASTTIKVANDYAFIPQNQINEVLEDYGYNIINSKNIIKMIVDEFNDYEEMISVIGNNNFVRQSIKNLDLRDKKQEIINYSRLFVISPPLKDEYEWRLSFKWHDFEEGANLLNEALSATLINVKKKLLFDLNKLDNLLEMKVDRKLETLNSELVLIRLSYERSVKKKIQYLTEQSAIARSMDLESSNLVEKALSQDEKSDSLTLSINSNNLPYYLRGYRVIDKEISLIKARTYEEQTLMADGYLNLKKEITSLENELTVKHLRHSINNLENTDVNSWVNFNLELAEIKLMKKTMLTVIIFSTVLGGMLGITSVIISDGMRNRKYS